MQLDRNTTSPKRGKYALIKLREGYPIKWCAGEIAQVLTRAIDFGDTADTDFFVIRLKDKYAAPALAAYAMAAWEDDPQYGSEVLNLAKIAARHPSKKRPD